MTRFLALALVCIISTTACADRAVLSEPVRACTKDAKMCADGSSVGRTGPDCQFPSCPEEKGPSTPPPEGRQMCTMDAKICPDGTGVGRTGPNCTFAPCPGEKPNPTPDAPPPANGEPEDEEMPESYE